VDILGITFGLDSAAALIRNGRPIAAVTDERFTRRKHSDEFPTQSIQYWLEAGEASIQDLDGVALFWNPGIHLESFNRRRASHYRHHTEYLSILPTYLLQMTGGPWEDAQVEHIEQSLKLAGRDKPLRIFYVTHHLAHAASAFYPSPIEEAAILTIDGYGEQTCVLAGVGRGHVIEPIKEIRFPHSLGSFYAAITQYLGYRANSEEGTVMALAAFGEPTYCDAFEKLVQFRKGGDIEIDLSYFTFMMERPRRYSPKFVKTFGPERKPGDPLEQRHKDLAAAAQRVLEKGFVHLARQLHKETRSKNLCMAGGVALNSVANGRLMKETPFEQLFAQPASGDNGAGLGAALYAHHMLMGKKRRHRMTNDLLGPGYSDEAIERTLVAANASFTRPASIEAATAELLARGDIVGWFQGRMEFGPRALGARSILAHPGLADMKQKLNDQVKHREAFRPFAPSVLAENCAEFFEPATPAPFMLRVAKIRRNKLELVPAVAHVDGSARLHTVEAKANARFYRMIKHFQRLTGLPLVLNTSFNIKGEPIICTPEDALRCFFSTGLDHLAIGSFLLSK